MSQESLSATVRQYVLLERETLREAGQAVSVPSRHVIAGAVLENPFAGQGAAAATQLAQLAELSVDLGAELSRRALARLEDLGGARAYGKAVIVGSNGDPEHGAAMIHCRVGLSMRKATGGGPALIPGNGKQGGPGTAIDIIFGGIEDAWDYDAMDSMTASIPDAPGPNEIVLFIGFATVRANARIEGASAEQVATLVAQMKVQP